MVRGSDWSERKKATVVLTVLGAVVVLVLSMLMPAIGAVHTAAGSSAGGGASAAQANSGSSAAPATSAAAPASVAVPTTRACPYGGPGPCTDNHAGTLNVYDDAPGGFNTADPQIAYDTLSFETILNVYERLIGYNGANNIQFLPGLATCVPGTPQCMTDYGQSLVVNGTGPLAGEPVYWTFVIDSQAHFYDPSTHTSWSVYPSDVMFSIARDLAFGDQPFTGRHPGWLLMQALLPYGNPAWDSGIHYVFNNTPGAILSQMLVNDSSYCPAAAMAHSNGCITFIANGGGVDWPFFLQLVADASGASVSPCGWFSNAAQAAGMPGWGSAAAHGDGPCLLPDGGNTTNNPAWTAYLAALNAPSDYGSGRFHAGADTSWDVFENASHASSAVDPNVRYSEVGSGPYYSGIVAHTSISYAVNPAYRQPSGCSGAGGLAVYVGYCLPAPGTYIPNVVVNYDPDDTLGISNYESGQADFAGIAATHTVTLLSLASAGELNVFETATISNFFNPIALYWNLHQYQTIFTGEPVPNVAQNFFSSLSARQFLATSYPYATVESNIRTVSGVQYTFNAGGPIPAGMSPYYPFNVSYTSLQGDPNFDPTHVGGAAWWYNQAHNVTNGPYYDPQIAACTTVHPCTFDLAGLEGDPSDDLAINDWIAAINDLTGGSGGSGGAIQPFTFDITFDQYNSLPSGAYSFPVIAYSGTGWAPDYPDPTDFLAPMAYPDGYFSGSQALSEQLGSNTTNDNTLACGHSAPSFADLAYWAHQANNFALGTFNNSCQGVAYSVANAWMQNAASLPVGAPRILDYNLVQQILNGLAFDVYNGQGNTVLSAAPWIASNSINNNVMIGGGGDQFWYQIRYASNSVSFNEAGLPAGTHWSVETNLVNSNYGPGGHVASGVNTTVAIPHKNPAKFSNGTVTITEVPNGTLNYTFDPAGYTVVGITGTGTPGAASSNVSARANQYMVQFEPNETFYFNETGLPNGTLWDVSLTPQVPGGPAAQHASTTGTSISFVGPKSGKYFVTISKPADYKGPKEAKFTVPGKTHTTKVKFTLITTTIKIKETGLKHGFMWGFNLTGPMGLIAVGPTTKSTFSEKLINGTYQVIGWGTPVQEFNFTVASPTKQTITFTYSALTHPPVPYAPLHLTPTRSAGLAQPANSWLVAAAPLGREVRLR